MASIPYGIVRALALGFIAALSGCAVEATETGFSGRLVNEVGAGSVAMASHDELIEAAMNVQSVYGPAENKTMVRLMRGDLFRVRDADLDALVSATNRGRSLLDRERRWLRRTEVELRAADVPASSIETLDGDLRKFLQAWNANLSDNADELGRLADYLDEARFLFAAARKFIAATRRAQSSGALAPYDRLRRRVRRETNAAIDNVERLNAQNTSATEDRLAGLYNDSTDAQRLVSAVNDKYPDGYLAGRVEDRGDR